jgi:hypothetical protein
VCSLTKKRFQSEGTYESHTRTKKFREALRRAGLSEAPPPKIVTKPRTEALPENSDVARDVEAVNSRMSKLGVTGEDEDAASSASGWETDDEQDRAASTEVWHNPCAYLSLQIKSPHIPATIHRVGFHDSSCFHKLARGRLTSLPSAGHSHQDLKGAEQSRPTCPDKL